MKASGSKGFEQVQWESEAALAADWEGQPAAFRPAIFPGFLVHCVKSGWKPGVSWLLEHAPPGAQAPDTLAWDFVSHYAPHGGTPFQGHRLARLLAQRLNWERQVLPAPLLETLLQEAIPFIAQQPAVTEALETHWLSLTSDKQIELLEPALQALSTWPADAQASVSLRETLNDTLLNALDLDARQAVFNGLMDRLTGDATGELAYDVERELAAFEVLASFSSCQDCVDNWEPRMPWLEALRAPSDHRHALGVLATALNDWAFPSLTEGLPEDWARQVGQALGSLANDQRAHALWATAVDPLVVLQRRNALPAAVLEDVCQGFLETVDDAWDGLSFEIEAQSPENEFMGWVRRHRQVKAPMVACRGPRL